MPGLYKDTYEKTIASVIQSIDIGPDIVRIYPTLVIKETKLAMLYNAGIYKLLSLNEAIEVSNEAAMLYKYADINIIRIGLQPTENINEGTDVIGGPFHPAIGQLVESEIYKKYLEELIRENNLKDEIIIFTNDRNISLIAGNNKSNKKYFYDEYKLKLKFKSSDENFIEYEGKKLDFDLDDFIDRHISKNYGGDLILD